MFLVIIIVQYKSPWLTAIPFLGLEILNAPWGAYYLNRQGKET